MQRWRELGSLPAPARWSALVRRLLYWSFAVPLTLHVSTSTRRTLREALYSIVLLAGLRDDYIFADAVSDPDEELGVWDLV